MFLIIDLLSVASELEIYFDGPRLLHWNPNSFFDKTMLQLSQLFGISALACTWLLWGVTMTGAVALVFKQTRAYGALLCWICLVLWLSSDSSAFYGVHFYFVIFLMLASLCLLLTGPEMMWKWGRIFLVLTYFSAGYAKLQSVQWRDGQVMWNFSASMLPSIGIRSTEFIAPLFPVIFGIGWVIILSQTLAPVILWKRSWSKYWLAFESSFHAVVGVWFGIYLFSGVLIFLNLAFLGNEPSANGKIQRD